MTVERVPVPVDTRAPGGATNAYLVGEAPALLVDPAARTPALDRAVAEREVGAVAVTHPHPDHTGAVGAYAAETGATVLARRGRVDRFVAATGWEPDATVGPDEPLPVSLDTAVVALDTPGHAPDHIAFTVGGDRGPGTVALVGDLVRAAGSVLVGDPEGDMRAYLASLRRLLARDLDRLFPGHGDPVERPGERLTALLAHRRDRERRVLRAVAEGAETVDAVLDRAYERDLEGVRDLAGQTVRAHLEKLAREDRLGWDGARARPAPTGRFYPHRT